MLFARQRLLLALLHSLGGRMAHTDFQKLLFLYTKEWEAEPSYEFVPYKFGGFSFTSYADKRRLSEQGLLETDEQHWILTETGRLAALRERSLGSRLERFDQRYQKLRGNILIAEQYRRFPYYAIRSEIIAKIITDKSELARIEATKPTPRPPGLLTIGYEGKSLEQYLNQLISESVTLLCDVRRNPLSRKYGFSKSTLLSACEGVGIRYEHLPELGIASEERRDLSCQADYDALFEIYERDNLPIQRSALMKIQSWIQDDKCRVALTCYEAQPCQCHRHCVAEALEKLGGQLFLPQHL
ncbi:MAG: DUF488 domain-containing protein [Opitutaceae bacterium]|jgi:hypothetical protein